MSEVFSVFADENRTQAGEPCYGPAASIGQKRWLQRFNHFFTARKAMHPTGSEPWGDIGRSHGVARGCDLA
jgi:hypothetical protein